MFIHLVTRHAAQYQHGSSMDIPVSGPTLSLKDSIAFDSKINDLTKVKPPTKEETHSLTLIIIRTKLFCGESMFFHGLISGYGSLCNTK